MDIMITLELTGADAFEIIAAVLIIVLTGVALFFLYRNVAYEIKEIKRRNEALDEDEELSDDSEEGVKRLITDESDVESKGLLSIIGRTINKAPEGSMGALYTINLDNFKEIVDKYEQKTVDKVIKEIEKKLLKHCAKKCITGHLEEDIFLYYYYDTIDSEHMTSISNLILELIKEPLKSIDETLTASIGLAVYPYDGINIRQLYKNADIAVLAAKKEGKNRFKMFSDDLMNSEKLNLDYYQEIKKSIKNDEFLLYYQAIVDIKTGRIIGLESLLRWNHPKMGILPPARFLNVMELTGDISWFGTWGFEKIVAQYKDWTQKIKLRDLFISTNLSNTQLQEPGLPEKFLKITKKYGLSSEKFCLEIIDYYRLLNNRMAMYNLAEFRKYGFRIAIDDPGPNYEIIQDMPDIIAGLFKVRMGNVYKLHDKDPESDQISAVIKNAKENSKVVIAEGIETEEMVQTLYDNGVRFMQGYFFNKPQPVFEIEKLLLKPIWNMSTFNHITNK